MARFRKIDVAIWNDEKFVTFNPLAKLLWFALLTHPLMTPMGAGVFYAGVLDDVLDHTPESCFRCQRPCTEHTAETYLEMFREQSLIYRDHGLIIVKNYLIYNAPNNPNQLLSCIGACEELPRSERFCDLLDHLQHALQGHPDWLFKALLIPLANQQPRGLVKQFWARVGDEKKGGGYVSADIDRNLADKVSQRVSSKVRRNHPRNQEKKQYQDEEKKESTPSSSPSDGEGEGDGNGPAQGNGQYAWPSPEALVAKYTLLTPATLPNIRVLSPARRKKAQHYLTLFPVERFWDEVFAEYHRSSFLQGLKSTAGHARFTADFDWLLSYGKDGLENCVKVHEGKYRDRALESPSSHDQETRTAHNLVAMAKFLNRGTDDAARGS